MTCFRPVSLPSGQVPCGRCSACRISRAEDWAARIVLEADHWSASSFVTFTYNAPHVLAKREMQTFIKLLRKEIAPRKLAYYLAGEYGEENGGAHYHAILFGIACRTRSDLDYSLVLDVWHRSGDFESHGYIYPGRLRRESARYVAGYLLKNMGETYEGRQRPFCLMSRNVGVDHVIDQLEAEILARRRRGSTVDSEGFVNPLLSLRRNCSVLPRRYVKELEKRGYTRDEIKAFVVKKPPTFVDWARVLKTHPCGLFIHAVAYQKHLEYQSRRALERSFEVKDRHRRQKVR